MRVPTSLNIRTTTPQRLHPFAFAEWTGMAFRSHARWTPQTLVATASFLACNDRENITEAFADSRDMVQSWRIGSVAKSFQGVFKQLVQHGPALLEMAKTALRTRLLSLLSQVTEEDGYVLLAVDGSRVSLPRTKSLQERFCKKGQNHESKKKAAKKKARQKTKSQQKKADSPQAWITVLYNLTLGLPWDFRTGPSGSSERAHVLEMLPSLPDNALITADAGFVGYDFWSALIDADVAFVIRVGANVKLLKRLGKVRTNEERVYLWPDKQQRQNQPPLALRLICLKDGGQQVFLVTNVLEEESLDEKQIIKIHRQRWQIELYYRTFKQTFGKRKLRCESADNAEQELTWSVIGLWMMMLYAAHQQWEAGEALESLSPAGVIKAFREAIRQWPHVPKPEKFLNTLIRAAQKDDYVRTSEKTNQDYPRKKQKTKMGSPTIQQATPEQRQQARKFTDPLSL